MSHLLLVWYVVVLLIFLAVPALVLWVALEHLFLRDKR